MMIEHKWQRVVDYGNGHQSVCEVCGCTQFYSWDPGWPGDYKYFDVYGSRLELVPLCRPLLIGCETDIEAAIDNAEALAPVMGR